MEVMTGSNGNPEVSETVTLTVHNCDEHCTEHNAKPEPKPPQYTRKQLGQLRRKYITIVHGKVKACGHAASFTATKQPRNNCVECWRAFFMTTVDLEGVHKMLTEKGVKALEATYGTKFMRNFHGFLATALAQPKGLDPEKTLQVGEL